MIWCRLQTRKVIFEFQASHISHMHSCGKRFTTISLIDVPGNLFPLKKVFNKHLERKHLISTKNLISETCMETLIKLCWWIFFWTETKIAWIWRNKVYFSQYSLELKQHPKQPKNGNQSNPNDVSLSLCFTLRLQLNCKTFIYVKLKCCFHFWLDGRVAIRCFPIHWRFNDSSTFYSNKKMFNNMNKP